jgi:DNA mismatch repair ATPase MutS
VEEGAIGIVTTHDLALTEIADHLAPVAANVHFRDVLVGDSMRFDYTLRPGVVDRGNALALMRLIGLLPPSTLDGTGREKVRGAEGTPGDSAMSRTIDRDVRD